MRRICGKDVTKKLFASSRKVVVMRPKSRTVEIIDLTVQCSSLPLLVGLGGWPRSIRLLPACKKKYCMFANIRRQVGGAQRIVCRTIVSRNSQVTCVKCEVANAKWKYRMGQT